MVNSGSKGKLTNIAQMISCLGQQNVDGKRIPFTTNDRTLPHYYKYDDSAESRGFVENSFISGQTPQEFFFHAMGGREGLIDTAVKTSTTGYVQRQLIKSMEDLKVSYDYSVRGADGSIIQFVYGDDGMDATFVESQPLILTKLTTEEIISKFKFNKETKWSSYLKPHIYEKLKSDYQEKLDENFMKIMNHREYLINVIFSGSPENNINYPVHIERIVQNEIKKKNTKSNISPLEILKGNSKLIKKCYINKSFKNNKIFEILIDIHLNPKILLSKQINKIEYNKILEIIEEKFNSSKISPGEMVGALAAQSIGEPATQMTLNTFHFAGVSAKSNVTRGIPRLKELIHVSKNIKSPSAFVSLKDEYSFDKNKANYIKNTMEYTILRDIVSNTKIYYEPFIKEGKSNIENDNEILEIYNEFNKFYDMDTDILPWIIRIVFDKEIMMDKGVVMEDIYFAIMNYDPEKIIYQFSDDSSKELIGRISIKMKNESKFINGIQDQTDCINIIKNINEDIMDNIIIKGIKGISGIIMNENNIDTKINQELVSKHKYSLETDGTNLIDILNCEFVDTDKTISNDILEIVSIFGIEAAREKLIHEINEVAEHAGEYINQRHIELLCDIMTSTGELYSINRQGIKDGNIGPLAKSSFENTTEELIKAGIFSDKDNLLGVSSNIMLGQPIKSGTGYCDILLDEDKLIESLNDIEEKEEEYIDIDESNIDILLEEEDEGECADNNFKFSYE